MTENMKTFLEMASQDKGFVERLNKAGTLEALITLAAEKGFALTAEDLKPETAPGEVSDEELNAVAGGKECACLGGGGGEKSTRKEDVCVCAISGIGLGEGYDTLTGKYAKCAKRCFCFMGGGGMQFD